ncbi:MAG: pantetheine-phosphate adenylyltransferase [Acholeplasmatales bacterium]|nr:pantetheine-phosphate adenylyltransferase [Acholeplasmatales bacterium]
MRKCVYPGSFDPISNGHLDIIKRASKLFDEVHVIVGHNLLKKYIYTIDERIDMINECVKDLPNVKVIAYDGLVAQYCKENNINIMVRGMRNYSDYENEFSLFQYNRDIYHEIETVILMPTTRLQVVSSSSIRELLEFGVDISKYVPKCVAEKITNKYKK